ncbi:hypothetical protein JHK87_040191 [Glycine soja]|nr:hypothetical protein JHK87_040191 [Glycine soja]
MILFGSQLKIQNHLPLPHATLSPKSAFGLEDISGESHEILDAEISACVLQLINICDSGFHSKSRRGSNIVDDWDERHHIVEEVKTMLMQRKEAATMKRDKTLSQAFSQQIWRNGRSSSIGNEDELEEGPKWLDRWMATKPWQNRGRASTDQRDPIKTVEIDTS